MRRDHNSFPEASYFLTNMSVCPIPMAPARYTALLSAAIADAKVGPPAEIWRVHCSFPAGSYLRNKEAKAKSEVGKAPARYVVPETTATGIPGDSIQTSRPCSSTSVRIKSRA